MIEEDNKLIKKRKIAADKSLGKSCDFLYSLTIDLIKKHHLSGSLLDFGAGQGILTKKLHSLDAFNKITAMDLMNRPPHLPSDIEWITLDLNNPITLLHNSFDILISLEVIEHLENPRATLRLWHQLLKKNGTLLFSTPNNESIRSFLSLIFRGHFVAFDDSSYPAHITPLLKKDIERILKETQFSLINLFYSDSGSLPKWTYWNWQQISFNLLRGRRFSDQLFVIAKKL